jgi:hypothetical protein
MRASEQRLGPIIKSLLVSKLELRVPDSLEIVGVLWDFAS